MTWTCALCGEPVTGPIHHFRLLHPQIDTTPDIWADGEYVVIDTTLTPEDFA